HNRVDAIQKLIAEGKVIEPIADFYKDEVRTIGELLHLPKEMIQRHPYPGPGLAIRILCHDPASSNTQLPATKYQLLPIRSVGVQGDNRTYAHPVVLTREADWESLDEEASRITNKEKEINRALLLLNEQKEPAEFRLPNAPKTLTPDRISLLQNIDAIVHDEIKQAGLYNEIWQFPVVLIPVGLKHFESIILRPVASQEAMTASFYRMPHDVLKSITQKIMATGAIDYVFYDITNKPPGTIEWE
ncbi:MAG: glutamine-hydrolyzing GMP synthase, partial [bacterium]|nr:glutamine-hydrolyzing GMP synthase [bacterium]